MRAIRTEIMRNRFAAIVEEAAIAIYRTAHTTFVKQTQDFQCALTSTSGEIFAYPSLSGVVSNVAVNIEPVIEIIGRDNFRPGDLIITNDPFITHGMSTHLPDIHVVRPVFVDGELLCFAWAFLHSSDVGGAVSGSISPTFKEVFQEGLRIRPFKIYEEDVLNEGLVAIIQDNCRIPEQIMGDIEAMHAALQLAERRMMALSERYGVDDVRAGIDDVLSYAEQKARSAIGRLPDGRYSFMDYMEVVPGRPIMLNCVMTVAGKSVDLDFSGSSPQVAAACNFVNARHPSPALCRTILSYVITVEPDTPLNAGILRVVNASAPKGTVLNAEYPAAMGNRAVTFSRVYDVVLGCLNQAVREGLMAAGGGQAAIVAASVPDRNTRRPRVAVIQPMIGGSGGRRDRDGIDGIDVARSNLRSIPAEVAENEMPLLFRRFGLEPESFGAGEFRGGAAVVLDLECREAEMTMTVRGCDRLSFQPWGIRGGGAGATSRATLNGKKLGLIEVLSLSFGDRLYLQSPGGGGFGCPFSRDPERVATDVRNGYLSVGRAREDYGVVVADGVADAAATAALRRTYLHGATQPAFTFGGRRDRLEAEWPAEAQIELSRRMLDVPAGLRQIIKLEVENRLNLGATPAKVAETIDAALQAYC